MSREIVFRLEGTMDQIHGNEEGGITVELKGDPVDLMSMIISGMIGNAEIAAMINGASSLFNLRRTRGNIYDPFEIELDAFLTLMRADKVYCAEITGAVVEFWTAAGVNLGDLPKMVKKR